MNVAKTINVKTEFVFRSNTPIQSNIAIMTYDKTSITTSKINTIPTI